MPGATRRRILVADDNRDLCDLICLIAGDAGLDAQGVYDGAGFRAALEHFHPDCVLIDLVMPDEDGFELLRHLRDRGAAPRVIVASSQPDAVLDSVAPFVRGLGLELAGVLIKPFTAAEFRAVL